MEAEHRRVLCSGGTKALPQLLCTVLLPLLLHQSPAQGQQWGAVLQSSSKVGSSRGLCSQAAAWGHAVG